MKIRKISILLFLSWFTAIQLIGQQTHEHSHGQSCFDPDQDRWYWQLPNRVMDEPDIKSGITVADVGAGSGYFTFRLSNRVGKAGKVYDTGLDVVQIKDFLPMQTIFI